MAESAHLRKLERADLYTHRDFAWEKKDKEDDIRAREDERRKFEYELTQMREKHNLLIQRLQQKEDEHYSTHSAQLRKLEEANSELAGLRMEFENRPTWDKWQEVWDQNRQERTTAEAERQETLQLEDDLKKKELHMKTLQNEVVELKVERALNIELNMRLKKVFKF